MTKDTFTFTIFFDITSFLLTRPQIVSLTHAFSALSFMPGRMKAEDRCYKSKAVPDYNLFRPQRTAVTILSPVFFIYIYFNFFFFFPCQERQKEISGRGGQK